MNLGENLVEGWFGRLYELLQVKPPHQLFVVSSVMSCSQVQVSASEGPCLSCLWWSAPPLTRHRTALPVHGVSPSLHPPCLIWRNSWCSCHLKHLWRTFKDTEMLKLHILLNTAGPRSSTFQVWPQQISLLKNQAVILNTSLYFAGLYWFILKCWNFLWHHCAHQYNSIHTTVLQPDIFPFYPSTKQL